MGAPPFLKRKTLVDLLTREKNLHICISVDKWHGQNEQKVQICAKIMHNFAQEELVWFQIDKPPLDVTIFRE